jgi:integrase
MAWIRPKRSGYLVCWRDERRRERSKYVTSREEAEALKAELDREAEARRVLSTVPGIPGWDDPGRPLDAADPTYSLERYLGAIVRGNRELRATTREVALRNIRVHIADTPIGRADIRTISPEMLTDYWGRLDVGRGALSNIAQLLRLAFRRALRDGVIESNPLERTDIRKPSGRGRRDIRPLTVAEVERLADAAPSTRDRIEVLLMAYCGLRAGEVGGLRAEDVDVDRGQLHVRQQVVRIGGQMEVADLKTPAARRVVTVPASVLAELREYVDDHPLTDGGPILRGATGGMRDAIRINRSVQRAATHAGLRTHAHALRHTFVSLLVADGASPIDVQHAVGHSNVQTTLAQYAHLFTYGGKALADSLERRREAHRINGESTA